MEAAFWATTLACGGYLLFAAMQAEFVGKRSAQLRPDHAVAEPAANGAVLGKVGIPALGLSAGVVEGDDPASLLKGLGHIRGTAELGGLGNVGLAGHRDTFLRSLRRIAPGMLIRASNAAGFYNYIVDSTEIVEPEAVEVLATHARPELTLITCYPFHYTGPAPKRFVVHAHLLSVAPEELAVQ